MRLVYTADLHGDIAAYRALCKYAQASAAQALIVGGDLLPHAIRLGDALDRQRAFVAEQLRPLLAEFRARTPGCAVYLLPGNDDWAAAIGALGQLESAGLAFPLHQRVYALAPLPAADRESEALWLAGYGCVPVTPFSIKDYERHDQPFASSQPGTPMFDFGMAYASWRGTIESIERQALDARPSIAEDLDCLARQSDPRRTIYVCHTPPADTPLDQMPRGRHIGSRALRAFIERHQPPLTLHGHIHESPEQSGQYAVRLGRTWSINPGHSEQRFQAVALDTDDIAGTIEHTVYGKSAVAR